MSSHYMKTTAGRREELDVQLHIIREKSQLQAKLLSDVSSENEHLAKEEILAIVEKKIAELLPSTLNIQGRVVHVNDEIRVKDDAGLLAAAERSLPVQDSLKRIYLGERGRIVQIVSSFHGEPAAVIRFADGAEKVFFVDCLGPVHGAGGRGGQSKPAKKEASASKALALEGAGNEGSKELVKVVDQEESCWGEAPAAEQTASTALSTWDTVSMSFHQRESNAAYRRQSVSSSSSNPEKVAKKVKPVHNAPPPPPSSLSELFGSKKPGASTKPASDIPPTSTKKAESATSVDKPKKTVSSNVPAASSVGEKPSGANIPIQCCVLGAVSADSETSEGIRAHNAVSDARWTHQSLGGSVQPVVLPTSVMEESIPAVEPEIEIPPLTFHVIESNAPLPNAVVETLAHQKNSQVTQKLPKTQAQGTAGATTGPPSATRGNRSLVKGLVKHRIVPIAESATEDLGDPLPPAELSSVSQLGTYSPLHDTSSCMGLNEEDARLDSAKLTGIPQRVPSGYKPKFSFYDANTCIPRFVPAHSSVMRHILVGGCPSASVDASTSIHSVDALSLQFVEVAYRQDASMASILENVTTALGWSTERAQRLFTTNGNEVLWEENIEPGTQLIATAGQLYHPVNRFSEMGSQRSTQDSVARMNDYSSVVESEDRSTRGLVGTGTPFASGHVERALPFSSRGEAAGSKPVSNIGNLPGYREISVKSSSKASSALPFASKRPSTIYADPVRGSPCPNAAAGSKHPDRAALPTSGTPRSSYSSRVIASAAPASSKEPFSRRTEPINPEKNVRNEAAESNEEIPKTKPVSAARPVKSNPLPRVSIAKPKHIKVFENGLYDDDERVFRLITVRSNYKTIGALKTLIGRELEWRDGKKVDLLFDATGVPITSLEQISDGDALVASSGDRFIVPYPNSVLHREALRKQ